VAENRAGDAVLKEVRPHDRSIPVDDRRDSVTARPWRRPGRTALGPATRFAYRIAAAVFALVLWQVAVVSGLVSNAAVATPTDIVQEAAPLLATPAFGAALSTRSPVGPRVCSSRWSLPFRSGWRSGQVIWLIECHGSPSTSCVRSHRSR